VDRCSIYKTENERSESIGMALEKRRSIISFVDRDAELTILIPSLRRVANNEHNSPASACLHRSILDFRIQTYAGGRSRGKGRSRRGKSKGGGSDELHLDCLLVKRFLSYGGRVEFVMYNKASVSSLMVASFERTKANLKESCRRHP
jgi:hypothetical protein